MRMIKNDEHIIQRWLSDWCLFVEEAMEVNLDVEQKAILRSVQFNKLTSVASGTARGKDFVSAVAAICFLYLMPSLNSAGQLESTKVALTAPTDRQVKNIMMPEIAKIYYKLKSNGICPNNASLLAYDIRTRYEDIFLTGFKADESRHEAWSGFHAVNTMFVVTEASGIPETVFEAIEGNLQGNSRLLIVFNDNTGTGYAANSRYSSRFNCFRLDSLNAPNVIEKKIIIPGQVDYEWVVDKVKNWCNEISQTDVDETEGDFEFEIDGIKQWFRPNDLFRVKVRGMAPKVSSDTLIPREWITLANERWKLVKEQNYDERIPLRLGVDVAGMGRDSSCFCFRYGNFVERFSMIKSNGTANHMEIAGIVLNELKNNTNDRKGLHAQAFIDTVGEGAGVFSRLEEQNIEHVYSCKFSESAEYNGATLNDQTGQYEFLNMRAYLFWSIRDWLNPSNKTNAALPHDQELFEELTQIRWKFRSDGKIQIEAKEDIKKKLKRSPDKSDALANTFYPVKSFDPKEELQLRYQLQMLASLFK